MCDYCTCRNNDPVPGMRVGVFMQDVEDYQGDMDYSWTGNVVYSIPENMNPVPPVGDQYRQQMMGGNGPQALVDSSTNVGSSNGG